VKLCACSPLPNPPPPNRALSGALFGPTVHLAWYHGKKLKPPNPFKLLLNIRNSPRFVVMGTSEFIFYWPCLGDIVFRFIIEYSSLRNFGP